MVAEAGENGTEVEIAVGQQLDLGTFLLIHGGVFYVLRNFDGLVDVGECHVSVHSLLVVTAPVVMRHQQHRGRVTIVPIRSLQILVTFIVVSLFQGTHCDQVGQLAHPVVIQVRRQRALRFLPFHLSSQLTEKQLVLTPHLFGPGGLLTRGLFVRAHHSY